MSSKQQPITYSAHANTHPLHAREQAIKASFGAIKLIDSSTSNCKDSTDSLPLGLGSITTTAFTCPAQAGAASVSLDIPIPNLSGKVTASSQSTDGSGNCLFCVDLDMTL